MRSFKKEALNASSWQNQTGIFPLPVAEATRLRSCLVFPSEFSALDPCVGEGVAFTHLLKETHARRYGIEIDANRAEQAKSLGIETLHADTMDVRCPAEALSLLYLNPPYDLEIGDRTGVTRGLNLYFSNTLIVGLSLVAF